MKELGLTLNTEAYIQSIVFKKTLESISLERRRGDTEWNGGDDDMEKVLESLMRQSEGEVINQVLEQ